MKSTAFLSFLFGLFFLCTVVSFAGKDSSLFEFDKPEQIRNVLLCNDENEALYIALREVEFFTAKKPVQEFYEEMDKYSLSCGVARGTFILSKIIHTYIGYNGDKTEPLEWNIVEATNGKKSHFGTTIFLFIPTLYLSFLAY